MSGKLPTIIVGGYLGAGKTTLVNHLLRNADGRRIAVMVNDFGQINIDAELIEARDDAVITLSGGCICCAFGSDLIGALMALPERAHAPDVVLIETSGVALPGAVARSVRLVPGIEIEAVVVMVDAETIQRQTQDSYVGDTVSQQLAQADLLILNKIDLLASADLHTLQEWLAERAARAPIIATTEAQVAPELLFGLAQERRSAPTTRPMSAPRAASLFASASFDLVGPQDTEALATALLDPELGLLRAKAVVRNRAGLWQVVQMVGARLRITLQAHGQAVTQGDTERSFETQASGRNGQLVVIGLRGRLDPRQVSDRLQAAGARAIAR